MKVDEYESSNNLIRLALGAFMCKRIKGNRESGESPERSRHCNQGALFERIPLIRVMGKEKERYDLEARRPT